MDFIQGLRLPEYESEDPAHSRLAELSRQCHRLSTEEDARGLIRVDLEADEIVARFWKLSKEELRAIRDAGAETTQPKRTTRRRKPETAN